MKHFGLGEEEREEKEGNWAPLENQDKDLIVYGGRSVMFVEGRNHQRN